MRVDVTDGACDEQDLYSGQTCAAGDRCGHRAHDLAVLDSHAAGAAPAGSRTAALIRSPGRPRRWRNRDCHRPAICCEPYRRSRQARRGTDMAICLVAPRHVRIALVLLAFSVIVRRPRPECAAAQHTGSGAVRAEGGRNRRARQRVESAGRRTAPPAAGFDHQAHAGASRTDARLHRHRRFDPAVQRQGRTASRYRLHRLPAQSAPTRAPDR